MTTPAPIPPERAAADRAAAEDAAPGTPPPRSSALRRFRAAVDRVLGVALVVLMGASVVNVLWQVATRFGSRFIPGLQPSSFTDELARFLLIWVGLLGAAYASGQRMHLAIDLLPRALTGRRQSVLAIAIQTLILLFAFAAMVVGGSALVGLSFELGQTSASLEIPLGVIYAVVPLAGLLIAFYAACEIVDEGRTMRADGGRSATTPAPAAPPPSSS